jgi:hypothetical protein
MTSTFTDERHAEMRLADFPEGFTHHKKKTPPVKGRVYIELLHKTPEGYGISPRVRADLVSKEKWATPHKTPGAIVGWRLAPVRKPEEEQGGLSDFVAGHVREMQEAAAKGAPADAGEAPAND